jgi:CPA2 family monovalent cation:H+ antiporter-2
LSIVAIFLAHRIGAPSIVGFLVAGVVAGPHGLGLIHEVDQVEALAEIGVVLLLFVIGMELSLSGLVEMRRAFLIGGTIQMFGTAFVVGAGAFALGQSMQQSVFLGFVVALSSTAIVLKLLQERAELDSPHGRVVLGTLIYQDIAVVPLVLAVPFLAGSAGAGGTSLDAWWVLLAKGVGVAVIAYIAFRWAVPWLLDRVTRTGSREAFLLSVLLICIGIALLTSSAGLSLALGAFLAGLIISESDYSHQAVSVILPFRDVFMSLFFVSVGMLLDVSYVVHNPLRIVVLTAAILLIKPLAVMVGSIALGLPMRNAVLAGLALAQVGEFSLVVAEVGVDYGLLDGPLFQTVLASAVASMVAAPFIVGAGPRISEAVLKLPMPERWRTGIGPLRVAPAHPYEGHVVIVGYGVTGHNVARAARESGVPYAVLEIDADAVREGQERGDHIHFGDATHETVLEHVNIERAKAVVVIVNDPVAARRITELARRMAPDAYVLVRSRYVREAEVLYELGADEVIADELEVSIEIFSRVLGRCLVPREDIERYVAEARAEWREMARSLSPEATSAHDMRVHLPDMRTCTFRVSEHSPLQGRSIAESGLRPDEKVTVLAVTRDGETLANPVGATVFERGDEVLVIAPVDWDSARVR